MAKLMRVILVIGVVYYIFMGLVMHGPESLAQDKPPPTGPKIDEAAFKALVKPFLEQHCIRCHAAEKKQGKFAVHGFGADLNADRDGYARILERLQAGDMPPEGERRPDAKAVKSTVSWIQAGLGTEQTGGSSAENPVKPNEGNRVPHSLLFGAKIWISTPSESATCNRVPHSLLFGAKASVVIPPTPRLWRMRPNAYFEWFVHPIWDNPRSKVLTRPFNLIDEPGIKDFAQLYSIDGAGAEALVDNAQLIVEEECRHTFVVDEEMGPDGLVKMIDNSIRDFAPLLHPKIPPTDEQLKKAIGTQFHLALLREPTSDELARMIAFYERTRKVADLPVAAKAMLAAPLLMPEAVYRFEIGRGKEVRPGVRMLSPQEVAFAVSLALSDRRDNPLFQAAGKGELTTREEVGKHVRRMLDDPEFQKPRLLGFFREYFDYAAAGDVFKDKAEEHLFRPQVLVADTID